MNVKRRRFLSRSLRKEGIVYYHTAWWVRRWAGVCTCLGWERHGYCSHVRKVLRVNDKEKTRALILSPPVNLPSHGEITIMRELAMNFQNMQGQAIPGTIKTPEQAFAVIATGRALGMDAATAFRMIFLVDGRTALLAEGLRAVAMSRDPSLVLGWPEVSADKCTVTLSRSRLPQPITMTISIDQVPAKLKKKDNWTTYPMEMLIAYASRRVIALGAPDLINIAPTTVSEAEEMLALPQGADYIDAVATPAADLNPAPLVEIDKDGNVVKKAASEADGIAATVEDDLERSPPAEPPTEPHQPPPEPPQPPQEPAQAPLVPATDDESLEASAPPEPSTATPPSSDGIVRGPPVTQTPAQGPPPAPAQEERPAPPIGEEKPDPRNEPPDRFKEAAAPVYRRARELGITKMDELYAWLGIANDCGMPLVRYWFEKAERGGLALDTAATLAVACIEQVAAELKEKNASILQAVGAVDPVGQLNHLTAAGTPAKAEA